MVRSDARHCTTPSTRSYEERGMTAWNGTGLDATSWHGIAGRSFGDWRRRQIRPYCISDRYPGRLIVYSSSGQRRSLMLSCIFALEFSLPFNGFFDTPSNGSSQTNQDTDGLASLDRWSWIVVSMMYSLVSQSVSQSSVDLCTDLMASISRVMRI